MPGRFEDATAINRWTLCPWGGHPVRQGKRSKNRCDKSGIRIRDIGARENGLSQSRPEAPTLPLIAGETAFWGGWGCAGFPWWSFLLVFHQPDF